MDFPSSLAKKLLQIKAIKLSPQKPFTWASGMLSPIYCDNRIALSDPETRDMIKEGLSTLCEEFWPFDCISGVATAGIAHGAILADYLDLPFSYVRSKAKEHGRQNLIEGHITEGSKCIVIEDLISTGGSSIAAVKALREAEVEVLATLSIFTYELEIAKQNFASIDCKTMSLSNYGTLIDIARETDYITQEEVALLKTWAKDPKNWKP